VEFPARFLRHFGRKLMISATALHGPSANPRGRQRRPGAVWPSPCYTRAPAGERNTVAVLNGGETCCLSRVLHPFQLQPLALIWIFEHPRHPRGHFFRRELAIPKPRAPSIMAVAVCHVRDYTGIIIREVIDIPAETPRRGIARRRKPILPPHPASTAPHACLTERVTRRNLVALAAYPARLERIAPMELDHFLPSASGSTSAVLPSRIVAA